MQKKRKMSPLRMITYYVMIMVLLSLLVVATYTWISINQSLRVNDLSLYVNSQSGLEISQSPTGEWDVQLKFDQLVNETAPLRPVTWSEKEQRFYAANYGLDGRLTAFWQPLSDEYHSNRADAYGYYTKGVFYLRTDVDMDVSFAPAIAAENGASGTFVVGKPKWDSEKIQHYNGGFGAENAIRLGFRFTPVNPDGSVAEGQVLFVIMEPNANTHVAAATGYISTPSIDGADHLLEQERLILQDAATWTESDPVLRDHVIWTMGEFTTSPKLFHMKQNSIMRVEVYIWLEGQDVDCNNRIGKAAEILANIQFTGDVGQSPGLTPIA